MLGGTIPQCSVSTDQHKIVIAGNHELSFHAATLEESREYMRQAGDEGDAERSTADIKALLTSCTYLEDEPLEVMGIKFYGSPWQPRFSNSAFNLERGAELGRVWASIPGDTEVLVTHGPPLGLGDRCLRHGEGGALVSAGRAGCEELVRAVVERVRPRCHVFGHVHEGHGVYSNGETVFINASTCNKKYQPVNGAVVVNIHRK